MSKEEKTKKKFLGQLTGFAFKTKAVKERERFSSKKDALNDTSGGHSWRTGIMAIVYAKACGLSHDEMCRAHMMASIHDLGKSKRDFDRRDNDLTPEKKEELEKLAFYELISNLPLGIDSPHDFMEALWCEYKEGSTKAAKFARALANLETMMQILEAGYTTYNKPWLIPNYADKSIVDFPLLCPVLNTIKGMLKKEFAKGKIPWKNEYDTLIIPCIFEQRQEKKTKREPLPIEVILKQIT